jgi:hypothetical protein
MHFYSPKAALARGIKTLDEQMRGLYGAVGQGPDLTPQPLRANESAGGAGLMHIANNLIAGMRAKQNYLAKRDELAVKDQYQQARIAEIRQKLQPEPKREFDINGQKLMLTDKEAAPILERMIPNDPTGAGREATPIEVATFNRMLPPKFQLNPSDHHTQFELASVKAAYMDELDRDERRRTAGGAASKSASLNAALGEIDQQEKAAVTGKVAGYERNVNEWGAVPGPPNKDPKKPGWKSEEDRLRYEDAKRRLELGGVYIMAARDSAQAAESTRNAPRRAAIIAQHGGIDVGAPAPPVVGSGEEWLKRVEAAMGAIRQ